MSVGDPRIAIQECVIRALTLEAIEAYLAPFADDVLVGRRASAMLCLVAEYVSYLLHRLEQPYYEVPEVFWSCSISATSPAFAGQLQLRATTHTREPERPIMLPDDVTWLIALLDMRYKGTPRQNDAEAKSISAGEAREAIAVARAMRTSPAMRFRLWHFERVVEDVRNYNWHGGNAAAVPCHLYDPAWEPSDAPATSTN